MLLNEPIATVEKLIGLMMLSAQEIVVDNAIQISMNDLRLEAIQVLYSGNEITRAQYVELIKQYKPE